MPSGIYTITVRRPSKPDLFYIGQASDLQRRCGDHLRHLRRGTHDNKRLSALFTKYGADAFSINTVLICLPNSLLLYEQSIVDFYVGLFGRRVLNICRKCVASSFGTKMSIVSRSRMSAAKIGKSGRPWTDEQRSKLSEARKGIKPSLSTIQATIAFRTGKALSVETRKKMSASQKGRRISLETRIKMSENAKCRSPEHLAKISEALKGNRNCVGNRHSAETLLKLSAAAKLREAKKRRIIVGDKTNSA